MDPQTKKELILSLIRDGLLHQRLIQGLHALGFEADDYALHLGTTILSGANKKEGKFHACSLREPPI